MRALSISYVTTKKKEGEPMLIRRTMKFKLQPNRKQTKELAFFLQQYAFLYNGYLQFNIHKHKQSQKFLSTREMFSLIPKLKSRFPIIKSLPSKFFEYVIVHLAHELKNMKSEQFPRVIASTNDMFFVNSGFLVDQQEKTVSFKGIAPIKFLQSKQVTGTIRNIAIQEKNNQWYVHVFYEYTAPTSPVHPKTFIGIDVGLKEFAILSDGRKIVNPRYYRTLEKKLNSEQKKLNRKKMNSKNWEKQRKKIRKIYQQIVNFRMNFLHKITTYLVNNYDLIGIEKLSIQDMVKNKKYAKSILDASWGTFVKMLKYKAEEKQKVVVEVERFYPSSQLCSKCGSKQFMPLHLRTFRCKSCHHTIDRDYNASINIEKRAKEIYYH